MAKKSTKKSEKKPAKKTVKALSKKAAKSAKAGKRSAKAEAKLKKDADAIALLKADHRTVEDLFESFEAAKSPIAKRDIAREICLELVVHAQIEEEIFYPAVKDAVEDDLYAEAHVEHDGAKVLIAEILAGDPGDEFYDANVKVLSEMIKHHVHEEEMRDGMFAQARKSDVDMDALGAKIAERKADLTALYKRNGLPRPKTRTFHSLPELELGQPVG